MKFEIFIFKKVISTNDEAIKLIKKNKKKTGCVYAEIQTKGKGTYGKQWISKKGNLFSSIFFPLKKSYPKFNEFSIINSVIVCEAIKKFCKKNNVTIKWPNDVFVNGKKISGILQELITFNNTKFLVIGIGINVVSSPKISNNYKATNIFLETKVKTSIKEILNILISSYEKLFSNLSSYNYLNFKKKAGSMTLNLK